MMLGVERSMLRVKRERRRSWHRSGHVDNESASVSGGVCNRTTWQEGPAGGEEPMRVVGVAVVKVVRRLRLALRRVLMIVVVEIVMRGHGHGVHWKTRRR